METQGIAPGLLLAMPQLADPNFTHGVVLMVEHTAEHSFGLVVNQPTQYRVEDVLQPMGIQWAGDPAEMVWAGGPVMPQSGWLLHEAEPGAEAEGRVELEDGLVLSTSPEQLRCVAEAPRGHVRFLMGYAGWGPGQLEGELAHGAWLTAQVSAQLLFDTAPEQMWEAALTSIGVDPATLFMAPGVH